ncbi:MAG TPA: hypothetical protein PLI65_07715, partial [Bacteroidales bacterium]|nr:hypothetical protein [Bacteroidales bacterium]
TLSKCLCFCAEDIPCQACPCIGEWFVFLHRNETITYKTKLYSFGKHFKTAVVKNKMDQLSTGILPKKKHLLRK